MTWLLCRGLKIDLNFVYRSKSSWFPWWVEINLISVQARITLDFVLGRNCPDFSVGDLTWLDFSCRDRNWLRFRVGVEKGLLLASGSKLSWFLYRGIEIGLNFVYCSKLSWFPWWVEFNLIFVRDSVCTCFLCWLKSTWLQSRGSNLTSVWSRTIFFMGIEKYLVLAPGSTSTWSLCRGVEIDFL